MQQDAVNELFGLVGTFPRPGWVVLDAAREHRFTGELLFDTSPPVRVYFDRGHIYLAERLIDPSFGARLVDTGAITAVQLERGSVRIGAIEHLGRLFERVPSLDRHTVVVTAELMTEECVGWLAAQRVPEVAWAPYRHHESGMHQWNRLPSWSDLTPGDPLPAPTPDEAPVSFTPPMIGEQDLAGDPTDPFLDGLIEWDEPSWLDGSQLEREILESRLAPDDDAAPEPAEIDAVEASAAEAAPPEPSPDWVDRLVVEGLPEDDPLASPKPLPRLAVEPVERFELVWPSGDVDEEFGAVDSVVGNGHDPDADRIGSTARLDRPVPDQEQVAPMPSPPPAELEPDDEMTDEVVLAVRRAVASIDVGSLAARQRLIATTGDLGEGSRGTVGVDDSSVVPEPGRVAVRSGRNDWSRRTVTRSVFDEPAMAPAVPEPEPAPERSDQRERRAGALRRLITSLRR